MSMREEVIGNLPYRELVSTLTYQKAVLFDIIETSAVILSLWQCYASLVSLAPAAHLKRLGSSPDVTHALRELLTSTYIVTIIQNMCNKK